MRTILYALAITVVFFGPLALGRADEERVPFDKLPAAIREAVNKRFPRAEMIGAVKENEDGKTEYEVTIREGGAKMDIMLTVGGSITAIEKSIAATSLPRAIQSAVQRKYPKSAYKRAEEVTTVKNGKEDLDFYEVVLETATKKRIEVQIGVDGKIREGKEEGKPEPPDPDR
jgi:hypothetical protein